MKKFSRVIPGSLIAVLILVIAGSLSDVKSQEDTRIYGDSPEIEKIKYLEGTVTDINTKKPVKGAVVEIKNSNRGVGYYKTTTDSRGHYRIDDFIAQIRYDIEVTAPGYVTFAETANITSSKKDVQLLTESVITGSVKDSAGNPVSDAEIKINNYNEDYGSESGTPGFVKTDSKGNYRLEKLYPGSYILYFSKAGYISESASLNRIKTGETFRFNMVMYRPASLSGKVMIEEIDAPAVNINITAEGRYSYSNVTYRDGSFILEDLKPGTYKITLSHQGFYQKDAGTVRIDEGKNVSDKKFTVKSKPPEIKISSYRYTFTPGREVEFNLRTLKLDTVKVKIWKMPVDIFLTGKREPEKIDPVKSGFKAVTEWEESVKDFQPYEWMYYSVKINTPLQSGGYCIEVKGKGDVVSREFFTVTNIGSVIKRAPENLTVYVTDLVQNNPVKDVTVVLYDQDERKIVQHDYSIDEGIQVEDLPVKTIARGKTDENGIFRADNVKSGNISVLTISPDGSYAICRAGRSDYYKSEKDKFYIYTDRPVYRSGDTVFFKIIAKRMGKKFTPIKNETICYSLGKSYSAPLVSDSVKLDEWGTATGSVVIPESSELGYFTINAGFKADDLYGSGSFYVEQYRKPEFLVEINPVKDFYINGDTVEFKVDTKYFFGAPLSNAHVKFRFYEKKTETDEAYYGDEGNGSYSRIKLEGDKYTDSSGSVVLKVAAGNMAYDRIITLEASVTDKSNVTITSQRDVRVGRGEFYVQIIPEENFFGSTVEKKVTVVTLSHAGKPVSVSLELNLYRYIWKPVERVYVHDSRPYFTKKITTGKDGRAEFTIPKDLGVDGEFDITAQGKDSRDNLITGSRVIWIYNSAGGNADSKFRNLELSVNKSELPGEGEVTCLLKSRYTDSYVLLTVEGRDIYEYRVVKMDKNVVPVKIKIKSGYAPNLFIRAAMQRGRALYTADTEVSLPTEDVKFSISLIPDKEKYGPGDKAVIKIKAADQSGKPVQADISLSAVDESIYSIRRDSTPEISSFFYSKISNWVLTSYSYPITLLAGAAKDSTLKVRENFRDTAFWEGSIRTDAKGEAAVSFTLPDNLTTWRLTARGHDQSGMMGEERKKFLTTQDIVVRTGKPRFFIEGDRVWLIGIVNNNTGAGIENIATEMKINEKVSAPVTDFKVSLPGYGSADKFYSIDVPEGKETLDVEFSGTVQGGKGDAVRHKIPVERRGIAYNISASGDMGSTKDLVIKPVKGDEDFEFMPEQVVITVNPSPVVQMLRAVEFMSAYEYGCLEQTINRFIPNIVLMNLMDNENYTGLVPGSLKDNLASSVEDGIKRIEKFQNYDGSWGWWEGDRGNGYTTGFAMFALHTAQAHGYSITRSVADTGLAAIERMFENREIQSNDEISYLLYIYSLYGRWNHEIFKQLAGDEKINAYMAANLIKAATLHLKGAKDDFESSEIRKIIPSLKKKIYDTAMYDSSGVYWTAGRGQSWGWAGGPTEITAHVLSALVLAGDTGELAAKAYTSLSKRFSGDRWVSTKTTGTVVMAMCEYLSLKETGFTPEGNISFSLNGEKIADFRYNLDSEKSMNNLVKIIKLPAGKKADSYKITVSGKASGDTTFTATVKGTYIFKPEGLFSFMKSEKRNIKGLSNGVSARRDIFFLNRVKDMKLQEYLVPQPVEEKSTVVTGDELLVRVRFTAQEDFGFMVLEDYLPSGFEVVKESAYNGGQPYSHVERRDNRMVFFFTGIRKGQEYEVAYIIRAELPGSFIMRPARIGCMYEESIQGWTLPLVIDVQADK
ncbi:MAG TPA: carboxypeptidase regulatory-like domain-containing protein [Spirochaetota bacterium]|nr:carboxypeptidase regulatory-like domain-containing protein [Spirochaetota bacterium]